MRQYVESLYKEHIEELTNSPDFRALEDGSASRDDYDRFIANVFETHQNSPHFLGFLFALVPPESVERIKHNLLEELGIEEEDGESHPALLEELIRGAGLEAQTTELKHRARTRLDDMVNEPLLYGSLRDNGLAAVVEIVSYEYMLSRVSSRIARFLAKHRGIAEEHLIWFTHHSEVDIQHAEEGLDTIQDYVTYYGFDEAEARDIIDSNMRENVFIKRYFGVDAAARSRGMV